MTIDHIVAMARGGPNVPENVVGACFPCNAAKATKDRPSALFLKLRRKAVDDSDEASPI
jgi:5-methylcytosine-specific restriction endonuclease McrA